MQNQRKPRAECEWNAQVCAGCVLLFVEPIAWKIHKCHATELSLRPVVTRPVIYWQGQTAEMNLKQANPAMPQTTYINHKPQNMPPPHKSDYCGHDLSMFRGQQSISQEAVAESCLQNTKREVPLLAGGGGRGTINFLGGRAGLFLGRLHVK